MNNTVEYISIDDIKNRILKDSYFKVSLEAGDKFRNRYDHVYEFTGWKDSWLTYDPDTLQPVQKKGSYYCFSVTFREDKSVVDIGMDFENVKKLIREFERL